MTDPVCAGWTAAFLGHLAAARVAAPGVLVGRDLRPSSPRIAEACIGAIRAAGLTAADCGVLPTPALALEAAARGWPAIMVTGSHIPFDRNGLKFYRPEGEITKADEAGILAARDRPAPAAAVPGALMTEDGARNRYAARMVDFFRPGALKGLRIGLWQHSAAGRDLTAAVLAALGATVVSLGRSDAFVPVDTEAVDPAAEAQVAAWTAGHGLDATVSTDGDGDRPLVADGTGRFLRGDLLGLLTARALGADAVATPISSTTAIERSGWVARVERTRIGSPFVIEAMERLAAGGARLVAGFEANGGFLLGGTAERQGRALAALPTRDALLPMLAVLTEAVARGITVAALAAEAPARATASDRLTEVHSGRSGPLLEALAADEAVRARLLDAVGRPDVRHIDTLDGVRLTLTTGEIVHLRASGNAPELRVYAEAADPARAGVLVGAVLTRTGAMLADTLPGA
jgi:phosphomannomutase